MIKAIAFDMDETLLDINLNAFIAMLANDESALLADAARANRVAVLGAYTRTLLEIDSREEGDERTNRELFEDRMMRRCGIPLSDPAIRDMLDFYEREVLPLKNGRLVGARPMPGAREAVEAALARGLRIALLTNPISSPACTGCRMGWAGIRDLPFEIVTTLDNSRSCKPGASYYKESLAAIGLEPQEVLMVGNDPRRDFPSPDCGLRTIYVGRGKPDRAIWCGRMAELAGQLGRIVDTAL